MLVDFVALHSVVFSVTPEQCRAIYRALKENNIISVNFSSPHLVFFHSISFQHHVVAVNALIS